MNKDYSSLQNRFKNSQANLGYPHHFVKMFRKKIRAFLKATEEPFNRFAYPTV